MSSSPPIDYAPPAPVHLRRSFRRTVFFTVALAFVASGWWWMPQECYRLKLLYWQHRCLNFNADPGRVAYDQTNSSINIPNEWTRFYTLYSPPGFQSLGTVFLGEVKNVSGERRLVALDLVQNASQFDEYGVTLPMVQFREFIPGNLFTPPREVTRSDRPLIFSLGSSGRVVKKVLTAMRDPADPTHLKFSYILDGQTRVIDIWLGKDDEAPITR